MKRIRIAVLPLLVVTVAALASSASASAHSWTYRTLALTKAHEATSESYLNFRLSGIGGALEEFSCHIWREYVVGPGTAGELKKVRSSQEEGESEKIKCHVSQGGGYGLGETATVEAAGLPWPTELYGEGTAIFNRFKQDGGTNRWLIRNHEGSIMWECYAENTSLEMNNHLGENVEAISGSRAAEKCTAGARELHFGPGEDYEFIKDKLGTGLGVN